MKTRAFALVVFFLVGRAASADDASPLADAAEKKDHATVAALLAKSVYVNAPQADGTTALHWAAYHDDLSTAAQLIKAGANPAAVNQYDVRPLFPACTNGNAD